MLGLATLNNDVYDQVDIRRRTCLPGGEKMVEAIVSIVCSMIATGNYEGALKIKGKLRLYIAKRRLKKTLENRILEKYGQRVYYNSLDKFLMNNNVLPSLFEYCYSPNPFTNNSSHQIVEYCANLFVEKNPEFSTNREEIYTLLMECYVIVFSCLNQINDEKTRAILVYMNEQLSYYDRQNKQRNIQTAQKNISTSRMVNTMPTFSKEQYYEYAKSTNGTYSESEYINRWPCQIGKTAEKRSLLDIVLEKKQVILLGDAGFGKTNESIRLLHEACSDTRTKDLMPVYLSLVEYGVLYDSIEQGIIRRIEPFISGESLTLIQDWLKTGKMLVIFDGIDDIGKSEAKERFILEVNDFISRFNGNFYLLTSRHNGYQERINVENKYLLSKIDEITVRKALQEAGIHTEIPRNYYDLFSNPFFLTIGKKILKEESKKKYFNRSSLFAELFHQLYDGAEHGVNNRDDCALSSNEVLQIIGRFAYENFAKSTYTYMFFDQKVGELINSDKRKAIGLMISSGVFRCDKDSIVFSHKLIKEYCVASYIANNISNDLLKDTILANIDKDEWKEVFIFVAGNVDQRPIQDQYLDYIMQRNLPLYIECVKSKCEVNSDNISNSAVVYRLLQTMLNTYLFITHKYFGEIETLFDPFFSRDDGTHQVGIRGSLSHDKESLSYWLEIINHDEEQILCLDEEELINQFQSAEVKQMTHRSMTHSVSLTLSGLSTESGRLLAIQLISNQLKDLIEHKQLIESNYLLCERLSCYKHHYKAIQDIDSIQGMKEIVDEEIENIKSRTSPNVERIIFGRLDLIQLKSLLDYLNELGVNYKDMLLPSRDIPFGSGKHRYIWSGYSKEQKTKRIVKYLKYVDDSYMQMCENNFPVLCPYFSRYKDHPCKAIALVDYKENEDESDFFSCPSVTYYFEAAEDTSNCEPIVREIKDERVESDSIFHDIQESYTKQGRLVNSAVIHSTSFSSMLTDRRTGEDAPLREAVYDEIKTSIEEIFGRLM